MELSFNENITRWRKIVPNTSAGKGEIETPGGGKNLRWQNRSAAPTEYEFALQEAFETAYSAGAISATEFVRSFNEMSFKTRSGKLWNEKDLVEEMARLGE